MSKASVELHPLTESDYPACAQIYLEAFHEDPIHWILHPREKQVHTQEKRIGLEARSMKKLHHRPEKKGFKAVDASDGTVLGYAIWVSPEHPVRLPKRDHDGEHEEDNEEVDRDTLNNFLEELYSKREQLMDTTPHWYLQFIAVSPKAQGRGVGKALLTWGLEQADKDAVPAYLEATAAGLPVYEKHGFEVVDKLYPAPVDDQGKKRTAESVELPIMIRQPSSGI